MEVDHHWYNRMSQWGGWEVSPEGGVALPGPYSDLQPSRAELALNQALRGTLGEDSVITLP